MFSHFAIKIIKSTAAVLCKLLPNTPGPHDTLQMCLRTPTQVGSVTQTPIQFMPPEHILPLGHQTQTHINTASDSWSCILVLTANYSLNGGLQRPCAGSLYVMGKRKKKPFWVHAFKFIYAFVQRVLVSMLNKDDLRVKGEQVWQSKPKTLKHAQGWRCLHVLPLAHFLGRSCKRAVPFLWA